MNVERNGFWVISCVVVTLQRISLITSYVVWYWLFQSCFFKWSLTYKTPDGTNNQKDALVFLPSSHQTVVIKSPNSLNIRALLYDGHFLQCAAHCLHLSLFLALCLLRSLPLSQLLLSQSISCLDFTSLFTTYLLLPSLSLFALSFRLSLTCISLPPSSDAALFSSVLV